MSKFVSIILSAGRGKRMGSDTPKQYLELNGKPVLYYSIKAFSDSPVDSIIIVTGSADIDYVRSSIVDKYAFNKVSAIVAGGNERYDSVYNGLTEAQSQGADYVMIHDGARAFTSQETITACMENVVATGACIAGMPVTDTIKVVDDSSIIVGTPPRSTLWMAQTPQCFEAKLAYTSYKTMIESGVPAGITDDAQVVEMYGGVDSVMVKASYDNIKITTPSDLIIGQAILAP